MSRVRIGFIGCGSMARHHGRIFAGQVPDAEIVALTDTQPENLQRFISDVFGDQKAPPTFSDHRAMLQEVPLDAVVIVTPHAHHFQQAVDAIDAGCHVLVEKPMVISTEDAKKLITHGEEKKRIISVAFPGPFTTEFQYLRALIAKGDLGEIQLVTGVCTQDWIANVGGTWRSQLALSGGGNLYDSGAHMFNAMLYLTGLAATEVFAFIENKDEEVDIVGTVAMRFNSGALGTAAATGNAPLMEQGIYIQGTHGAAKAGIYGGNMEVWLGKNKVKYPQVPEVTTLQQNFIDCINGKAVTPSPPILGLRQARLMDAIYESARTGAPVKVVADE
ncbi:MAG TPA: Gfo/Idh/MocA family oxidoreductase [Roseiflexaceae bacterium]|nr:Gfo/Idh/MocA family oxidoreductase [Roseiflexaceae bacterium]